MNLLIVIIGWLVSVFIGLLIMFTCTGIVLHIDKDMDY